MATPIRPLARSLAWFRSLEELSRLRSPVHGVHPAAALLVTALFLLAVMSHGRHAVLALAPLAAYPVVVASLSGVPAGVLLRPLLVAEPLVFLIGIANPWLDPQPVAAAGLVFARGWLILASLMAKTALAVSAATLLAAVLGMDRAAAGLRGLGVPEAAVLQLAMTYRYSWTLLDEASRLLAAYRLRSGAADGVRFRDWGQVAGGLLLRTHDRAERVHRAMLARGFDGAAAGPRPGKWTGRDWLYLAAWTAFFLAARFGGLPARLGALATGT